MKNIFSLFFQNFKFLSILLLLLYFAYLQLSQHDKIENIKKTLQNHQQQKNVLTTQLELLQQKLQKIQDKQQEPAKQFSSSKTSSYYTELSNLLDNSSKNKTISSDEKSRTSTETADSEQTVPDLPKVVKIPEFKFRNSKNTDIEEQQHTKETVQIDAKPAEIVTTKEQQQSITGQLEPVEKPAKNERLSNTVQIDKILKDCKNHLDAYRLTRGADGNAYDCYLSVIKLDKTNQQAQLGLKKIEQKYQKTIIKYTRLGKLSKAQGFLDILKKINPDNESIESLQKNLDENKNIF